MKKIILGAIALITSISLWAVPAYRGWQTRTQPDGSQITIRQVGDEFYHYWETEDGQTAIEQEDGTFILSNKPAPSVEQVKSRRAASALKSSKPHKAIGKLNLAPRGLLILVEFSNVSFASSNNNAAFNDMLNKSGYDYNGATGSAVDYFKAQSNNAYSPTFDVVGPVTLSNTRKYYGEQGTINGYKENDMYIADFVIDAVTAAEAAGCDFSQYDCDNDGYVDIVYFIYAGKGQANGGTTETIWPHNWELISALYYGNTHGNSGYYVNANSQGYITSMNIPTFDGKKINNYACSAELRGDGNRSGIGTFCHEFSHVLGLPDYYVTDEEASNNNKGYTPGAWSIMDYGSYNNDEMTPPNYSAYDKLFMGWNTPELLKKDAQRDVTITTGYSSSYQITGTTSAATATTEGRVWYLENRQKTGWDTYLPGHGMLVWEVTYNQSNWENNVPNNEDVGYTIVTANKLSRPYTPCIYVTDENSTSGTTFPGTSNVTSYTPATGCALTNIAESNGKITFKYNGGNTTYWTYELEGTHCTASASGQVDKNATLNLVITPEAGYTLADAECWAVEMGEDLLEYGTGFTYSESTNAFSIASVTGNVYIIATAKEIPIAITWMANGEQFAITNTSGGLVLPATTPNVCENKVFVGWTATANYSHATTAPTFVKTGDAATATTYYAVFAMQGEGGGTPSIEKAGSIAVGDKVILVYETDKKELSGISSTSTPYGEGAAYSTTPVGAYLLDVVAGNTPGTYALKHGNEYLQWNSGNSLSTKSVLDAKSSWTITFSGGNATIKNASDNTRSLQWNSGSPRFACYTSSQKAVQLYKQTGSGSFYADYTTSCTTVEPQQYTVRFIDKGTTVSTEQYYAGQTAVAPSDPETDCTDYAFAGWWTAELDADNTEAKEWITDFTVTGAQDYYAIYRKTEEGAESNTLVEDQLTRAITGVSGTSYSNWENKSVNSDAVYAGNSAGGNSSIQLRTDNNNSGIITTSSGGTITKVAVVWESHTADGRTLDVYGKNTAYSEASDLYGSAAGTKLGSIKNGESTELEIDGSYTFIGVRSQNKALYLSSITFTWTSGTSSTTYYSSTVSCQTTSIEHSESTNDNKASVRKEWRNGQIVIVRGEAVYSITGTRLK